MDGIKNFKNRFDLLEASTDHVYELLVKEGRIRSPEILNCFGQIFSLLYDIRLDLRS